jgi:hypothetical protein
LYTGLRLTGTTELLCDVQETGGHGIGEALGLAGFTNLDVVRNPSLSKAPYIARLMWHQIIPLSHRQEGSARTAFSLFSKLPERRLELRFGKFGIADFFDLNTYGSDSNFQFLNWTTTARTITPRTPVATPSRPCSNITTGISPYGSPKR